MKIDQPFQYENAVFSAMKFLSFLRKDDLIFMIGIPIHGKEGLYIEMECSEIKSWYLQLDWKTRASNEEASIEPLKLNSEWSRYASVN